MGDECSVEQRLCRVYRGDAIPFSFTFENDDGTPKDISGDKLYFTMKLDPNSADGAKGDLQYEVTFPSDTDSANGIGGMLVPASKTALLGVDVDYFYDFKYIEDGVPFTIGSGLIYVKLNITKAVS